MRSAAGAFLLGLGLAGPGFAQGSFEECYGLDAQQCFDFYPAASSKAPLVVLVHPGAWWTGDKADGRPPLVAQHLQSRGYAAASINYRYTVKPGQPDTPLPAQVDDVVAAVTYLRENADAARFDFDKGRVYLWGMSGGGYLVSAATLLQGLPSQGVVDLFGPTTFGPRMPGGLPAWDQDLLDAGFLNGYQGCNPSYPAPSNPPVCDPSHPGWFPTSGDPKSSLSALVGCSAYDPACPVDDWSLDDPARFKGDPPPFLIVHHVGDSAVALRQSERLAEALGMGAVLRVFKGGHYYIEALDEPAVDAFLDALSN